ncbi:ATP-binding protein [Aeromonas hydrophila]|uniref:AAA family ATPase n=1 Tax=Aeromonas hydrophila TaxID=644 RepID=UPI00191F2701|nr:AAA family ATPase [Aeromonas hydrophila]MBL0673147.1 ATP-binding protein [Aeromonas hydrophila]
MITIYTGNNGSGKSRELSILARRAVKNRQHVIAISTSLTDRFPSRCSQGSYCYMGRKLNGNVYVKAVKHAFISAAKEADLFYYSLSNILEYAGFDPFIGFDMSSFNMNVEDYKYYYADENDKYYDEEFMSLLYLIRHHIQDQGHMLWANAHTRYGEGLSGEIISKILLNEKKLRGFGFITKLDIVLSKNENSFKLQNASTGELSLIATTLFIAANIKKSGTAIFIDEPENSLHPSWQQQYIKNILNVFPHSNIDLFIATHSPLLISGSIDEQNVSVLRSNGIYFSPVDPEIKNVEKAYIKQFGIVTPENNALSQICIDLINDVERGVVSYEVAVSILQEYELGAYDNKQKNFLEKISEILAVAAGMQNGKNKFY